VPKGPSEDHLFFVAKTHYAICLIVGGGVGGSGGGWS
jgi:hypothetical protein